MNSKQAQRKCDNAAKQLAKWQAKPEPKSMPNPVGFLFPIPPVVPASKQYKAKWRAKRDAQVAKYRKQRDHWCAEAERLALVEQAERFALVREIDTSGGPVSGGTGGGDDWSALVGQGLDTVGDLATGLQAGGGGAPPSGVGPPPPQSGGAVGPAQIAGALAVVALVGGLGYVGYQQLAKR